MATTPIVISAAVTPDVAARVRALAVQEDRSVSYVLRRVIERGLEVEGQPCSPTSPT